MLTHRRNEANTAIIRRVDLLNPLLKAYALAYLTSTAPRLPSAIRTSLNTRLTLQQRWTLIRAVLVGSLGTNRFPLSCALIVGGSTLLPRLLADLISRFQRRPTAPIVKVLLEGLKRQLTFLSTFLSAWVAFNLLNRDESWARKRANSLVAQNRTISFTDSPNQHHLPPPGQHMHYAGKTIDFTLFSASRALDVLIITTWISTSGRRFHPDRLAPRLSLLAKKLADPSLFATSAAIIMWSWFYSPERLPKQYNQWISKVANIDHRLINALRLCRQGDLIYGSTATQNADLPSLCRELDLPQSWGNPAEVIPIPCELYHCGAGKSCETHAGKRFMETFQLAMRIYLPLQLLSLFRRFALTQQRILSLVKDAARSSSFLAAFVTLFYYAVCLARTRLGPKIFSKKIVTPQMWDSGLCVLAGCLACGWSIAFEKAGRRQEISSFVAPRALATLMPRVYDKQHQRREQLVFAMSVAVVMNAMKQRQHHVRGVLGRILEGVLR